MSNDVTVCSGAFTGCPIKEATIPSSACDEIRSSKLEKLVITYGSTTLYSNSLDGCTSLKSLVIPDSVMSISSDVFRDCTSLTSVTCSASAVYAIPKASLKTVVITSGYAIGPSEFSGCTSLTSITIPDSITSIGYYAFSGCSNLTSVYYLGTAEEWEEISIDSGNTPLTSATRYYYSENQPTEAGNYWHNDYNGNIVVW